MRAPTPPPIVVVVVVHCGARNLGRGPPWLTMWLGGPQPPQVLTTLDTFSCCTMKMSKLIKLMPPPT